MTVPLAPRTARALDLVVGERGEGPILVGRDGKVIARFEPTVKPDSADVTAAIENALK